MHAEWVKNFKNSQKIFLSIPPKLFKKLISMQYHPVEVLYGTLNIDHHIFDTFNDYDNNYTHDYDFKKYKFTLKRI